jgi:hypothetical protein
MVKSLNSIPTSAPAPVIPCSRTTAAAVRLLPTPSTVSAASFAKEECMHSDRHRRARSACQPVSRCEAAVRVPKPAWSSAQAPDLPQTVARPLGSVRLLTSLRSAPGAVIKVARRTALHVMRHDADRTFCMTVECRIAGDVRGVGCVPSRRSDRCTWSAVDARRDGKRAWCQVRPARRRVHGWATPTRSRPKRCVFQPLS